MQGTNSQRIYCDSTDVTCTAPHMSLYLQRFVVNTIKMFFFLNTFFMLTKATFI